jgi:putative ABC transport system permease protein
MQERAAGGRPIRVLLASLALQNLGRRKGRTLLLCAAVAVCTGAIFTGAVLMRSIENSMDLGFTRLGADMLVVPTGALTNITAALLTAEPSELSFDAKTVDGLEKLKGVARVAPQRVVRTHQAGIGHGHELVDLIAFDPNRDITVQPWLEQRLDRPFAEGDVIVGGRREEPIGSEILIFGKPVTVYGRLGKTAVGIHERGLFLSFATMDVMSDAIRESIGEGAPVGSESVSGVLIELAPNATVQQVRFAILANFKDLKVVSGESILTSVRQGLSSLLDGALILMIVMFLSTAAMVAFVFSAVIAERRRELGLLQAVGARRGQIVGMLLSEAAMATAVGGLAGCASGVLLMRLYEHSLVYSLDSIGIPFVWAGWETALSIAALCVIASTLIGAAGAFLPAWRATRREPYDLIRSEG